MGGTIIVSLGDSETGLSAISSNPLLGDVFALVSAGLYAVYITLIRVKLPDDDEKSGNPSMAQFLGFLGLSNLLIFLPVALVLNLTKLEPFYALTWKQIGLIIGKGLYFASVGSIFIAYYVWFLPLKLVISNFCHFMCSTKLSPPTLSLTLFYVQSFVCGCVQRHHLMLFTPYLHRIIFVVSLCFHDH